jgi:hypothetical protein
MRVPCFSSSGSWAEAEKATKRKRTKRFMEKIVAENARRGIELAKRRGVRRL